MQICSTCKSLVIGLIILLVVVSLGPSIRGNVEKINNSNILGFNEFEESFQKTRMENHPMLDRNDIQELFASDGATNDLFGNSVSIDGDYALIGAYEDDDNGDYSGSAYIFKRDGTVWAEQSKLLPFDGELHDCFGGSVSIDGDYALISASHDDDNGYCSGSAYVFKRDGAVWAEQSKLLPSDGKKDHKFGSSVAIDGDYVIIGAVGDDDNGEYSGSAYIFKRDGTVWVEQSKLLPSDGEDNECFGVSVSIDGDYTIIGAGGDDNGYRSGSAYIFKRDGTVWVEQSKLLPSDGESSEFFGMYVSIDGDYAIIGAWADDDNGYRSGSAYIFKRDGNIWNQQVKLLPSDGKTCGYFGFCVSIDGDYAIIGGYGDDDNGKNAGSVYVYKRDGLTWSRHVKLLAPDGIEDDCFGWCVAIDGDNAIIGAVGADGNESGSGSAYVFKNISEFQSPSIPLINGPISGKIRVKYTFFISTVDPDNDDVYYYIDWGDNTSNFWLGPYDSGEEISVSHRWSNQGNFEIRIKAKNTIGAVSDWGILTVTIPRGKATYNLLYLGLLERFPFLKSLLNYYN